LLNILSIRYLSFLSKRWFNVIIRFAVIALAYWFIVDKLYHNFDIALFYKLIFHTGVHQVLILILCIFLMTINWSLEIVKWKYLLASLDINFKKSAVSVIVGISMGIFTPNRIGEIGGRILWLPPNIRIKAAIFAVFGGISQTFATLIFGLTGFYFLTFQFSNHLVDAFWQNIIISFAIVFIFLTTVIFVKLKWFNQFILKRKWFKTSFEKLNILKLLTRKQIIIVQMLSVVRYLVFTFQFYLLLLFFGVSISLFDAYCGISSSYLVMAFVPTFALSELGVRSSVSLFFLGLFSGNAVAIVSAPLFLWLINVALPAVAGTIILMRNRSSLQTFKL